jgi:hypothetical protein
VERFPVKPRRSEIVPNQPLALPGPTTRAVAGQNSLIGERDDLRFGRDDRVMDPASRDLLPALRVVDPRADRRFAAFRSRQPSRKIELK